MISDGKRILHETVAHADRVGKVFIVVGQDVRRCLVCDGLFTRQAAAEHATTVCHPSEADQASSPFRD